MTNNKQLAQSVDAEDITRYENDFMIYWHFIIIL